MAENRMPQQAGAPMLPQVTVVQTTGSTNDDVKELGRSGAAHGSAIAARSQTAGRGRRGHAWQSPEGGLYLSILLRPEVPMHLISGLPAVCSLGILDAIHRIVGTDDAASAGVGLKWPNDVVVGRRKLVGILVEGGYGEGGMFAVCGLGLNILSNTQLEASIANASDGSHAPLAPISLEELLGSGAQVIPGFEMLATLIRDCVVERVDTWVADVSAGRAAAGPLAPILSEYFDCVGALGREVEALLPDGQVFARGRFAGIDVWGRATIVTPDGRELDISSEQASIREI